MNTANNTRSFVILNLFFLTDNIPTMLLKLITDARNALLLRYKPAAEYRYAPPAIIGILLLLGLQNAAAFTPLFGRDAAAIVFSLVFVTAKWLLLSLIMQTILRPANRAGKTSYFGFILATEALLAPALIVLYYPDLAGVAVFWQIWCFWAQAAGLMYLSRSNGIKVLLGYLCYAIAMIITASVLIGIFVGLGLFDQAELMKRSQEILKAGQLTP